MAKNHCNQVKIDPKSRFGQKNWCDLFFFHTQKFPFFYKKLSKISEFKLAMNINLYRGQFYTPRHQPGPLWPRLVHFYGSNSQKHFSRGFIKVKTS